ncbi:hypothetical protein BJX61DRAFT_125136 [Aspergillus egyptiacus]|nr:hypothetical protein BJX61DRAFT_125136 [Aspergillus egyptiacus]
MLRPKRSQCDSGALLFCRQQRPACRYIPNVQTIDILALPTRRDSSRRSPTCTIALGSVYRPPAFGDTRSTGLSGYFRKGKKSICICSLHVGSWNPWTLALSSASCMVPRQSQAIHTNRGIVLADPYAQPRTDQSSIISRIVYVSFSRCCEVLSSEVLPSRIPRSYGT